MRKNYLVFFLPAVMLGTVLSCKSAPEPVKAPPPKEVPSSVSQESLAALSEAAARAEAARKRAMDFDAPAYFPSEWEDAEAQFNNAANTSPNTEDNVKKAIDLYDEAAASYDELFEKAVPLYAQAREDEIMEIRDELMASAFISDFPEYLAEADSVALKALEEYESDDYYAAKDTVGEALEMYRALSSGALAYQARQEIIYRGFTEYDPENFEKADAAGTQATEAWDEGDIKLAHDSADEAQLRYNLVLNTAWAAYAAEKGTSAGIERQNALDVKANIAVRSAFNETEEMYMKAASSLEAEIFAEAAILFEKSGVQFAELVALTEEKRAFAETAIREAEEMAEASDEAARRAEEIIEGDLE